MSLLTKSPTTEPAEPTSGKKGKGKAPKPVGGRRRAQGISASVNLLSPWVFQEMRVRTLRQRFVAAAVVLLLVVAAAYGLLRMTLANAEADLRDDEAATGELQTQIAELSDVSTYVGNVALREAAVSETMAREVDVAQLMRSLDEALPDGAAFTAVNTILTNDPSAVDPAAATETTPCPGADPFGSLETVGCIELSGVADNRADIGAILQALSETKVFENPFVTATTKADDEGPGAGGVDFVGSVAVSEKALTDRYLPADAAAGGATDEGN